MRDCAESKRVFIQVLCLPEQREQKIRASHIVDRMAKESITKRIISEVLNNASAIHVSVCDSEIVFRSVREAFEQHCFDVVVPKGIHQRLVCEHRVASSNFRTRPQSQGNNDVAPVLRSLMVHSHNSTSDTSEAWSDSHCIQRNSFRMSHTHSQFSRRRAFLLDL